MLVERNLRRKSILVFHFLMGIRSKKINLINSETDKKVLVIFLKTDWGPKSQRGLGEKVAKNVQVMIPNTRFYCS